ncbi:MULTISPECIES: hypothetical protein [unclassified Blastococcus]
MSTGDDWLDQARRLAAGLGQALAAGSAGSAPPGGEPAGAHGGDCRWCPLCQAVAVLRGERPELTAALADTLSAAAAALRALTPEPPRDPAEPPAEERPDAEAPRPAVQHIEIA